MNSIGRTNDDEKSDETDEKIEALQKRAMKLANFLDRNASEYFKRGLFCKHFFFL